MLQEKTSGTADVHQTVPGTQKGHETTRSGRGCFKITFNKLSQESSIKLSYSSDAKYGSTALSTFTVGFLIHSYLDDGVGKHSKDMQMFTDVTFSVARHWYFRCH
jgi:hypothetical protein